MLKLLLLGLLANCYPANGDNKKCDVTKEPDVKYVDIRLPVITVPDSLTTYVCQQFKVPDDETYHAVAFQPLIDNHDVMHHMLLFGCPTDIGDQNPHACSAIDRKCGSWLAQWTMGVDGQICTYPDTGVRFGKDSFKYMALQIHWNNANLVNNMTDSSGMRIYYTRKLRHHDVGNVQIGQSDLEIPPKVRNYAQIGGCSSNCTRKLLTYPIYLTRTYIHMHYLGSRGLMEVYRDGKLVSQVADDPDYKYHLSPIHDHDPPVEVRPGDEIRLTCWFDTETGEKYRNTTVYYGEGSNAEMCFAFVTYYPRMLGLDQCIQFAEYDVCNPDGDGSYGDCKFSDFFVVARANILPKIAKTCESVKTDGDLECSTPCGRSLGTFHSHPCMQGRLGAYSRRVLLPIGRQWTAVEILLNRFALKC